MLRRRFAALDRRLAGRAPVQILMLALCVVGIVGYVDVLTGDEVSLGLFYLGPVSLAAWYVGRWPGVWTAVVSCITWYIADAGTQYSHPAIPVWNALVRLGFFLISGLLLTALRESLLKERKLARTDSLTGLFSRRAFQERLEHDLAFAQRRNRPLTLAYVDLDDFKSINDAFGHAEGDRVLQTTARELKQLVRRVDTVARLGGDEFALVLPDTDEQGAHRVITNLHLELRKAHMAKGRNVTCSIGVVTFLDPAVSPEEAVAAGDRVMYEVKRQGKGGVAFVVRGEAAGPRAAADPPQAALQSSAKLGRHDQESEDLDSESSGTV